LSYELSTGAICGEYSLCFEYISTGHFIIFSVITNICNKKSKGPTLMELFTATGKLRKVFLQLEMFDVARSIAALKNIDASMLTRVW
jgi:hypothetical protein